MSRINNHPHPRRTSDGRFAGTSDPLPLTETGAALVAQIRRQNARTNAARMRREYPLTETEAAALNEAKRAYAAGLAGRMEAALEKREGFRSLAFRSDLALEMYDGCHFAAVAFARQIVANL